MNTLPRIIIVCPSLEKPCGIARYSGYVSEALKSLGAEVVLLATTDQAVSVWESNPVKTIILIQHEYGLFDSFSDLGTGEATAEMLSNLSYIRDRPSFEGSIALIMHTMVVEDHVINTVNKQLFSSGFPIFHLNREGARVSQTNFMEHGVYGTHSFRAPPPFVDIAEFKIGAFGFLSPNKDLSSLFSLCHSTGARLHANFACFDEALKEKYREAMTRRGVGGVLTFDFLSETDLADFLGNAHVLYLPQHDIPHYATSGSARFALGTGRPLLVPAHRPFHDIASCVVFGDLGLTVAAVTDFAANQTNYRAAVDRVKRFVERYPIAAVYQNLIDRLLNSDYVIGGHIPNLNQQRFFDATNFFAHKANLGPQIEDLVRRRYRLSAKAIELSGQVPAAGRLWQAIVGWEDDAQAAREEVPPTQADLSGETKRDISRAQGALNPVLRLSAEWELSMVTRRQNSFSIVDGLLRSYCGNRAPELGAASLLRLFGLDNGQFPFLEFIDLPLIVQAVFFKKEHLLTDGQIESLCHAIIEAKSEMAGVEPSRDLSCFLLCLASYRKLPFWADIGVKLRWSERLSFEVERRDPIRHPAGLLAEDPRRFVIGVYLTLLGRLPDFEGFNVYLGHLRDGLRRSEMISEFFLSSEYLSRGAAWIYGDRDLLETWDENYGSLLSLFHALAPNKAKPMLRNFRYWDAVHMDRINERLAREKSITVPV